MKCIEAQQLVKPYIEGQLSDKQLEQFLDHVEHCPECYEELEIYFSIYETLGNTEKNQDEEVYDFEGKLKQDIKNSRRYLHLSKAYRLFRLAVVMLAELLLVCTIITGIELKGDVGSEGTTIYRVIYGKNGKIEIDYLSESEAEAYQKEKAARESEAALKAAESEREREAALKVAESESESEAALKTTENTKESEVAPKKTKTVTETEVTQTEKKDGKTENKMETKSETGADGK